MPCIKWTADDDTTLMALYESKGPEICSDVLGRTIAAVHKRANKLGLKYQKEVDRQAPEDRIVEMPLADWVQHGPAAMLIRQPWR